jgi:hypothetical protein
MKYDRLDHDTFLLYCAKYYNNAHCQSTEEFYEDLKHIKYIKKLLTRYDLNGDLKERLILNHIIILNNMFGPIATSKILFFKLPKYHSYLKPFLILLNILPDMIYNLGKDGLIINTDDIPLDTVIVEALRKI